MDLLYIQNEQDLNIIYKVYHISFYTYKTRTYLQVGTYYITLDTHKLTLFFTRTYRIFVINRQTVLNQ